MLNQIETRKQSQLNPNWAQMRDKIKSVAGFKPTITSENPNTDVTLGKRKELPSVDYKDSQINPLIPISNDFRLTAVVAMDCEMVGVSSEGNKSALGRVILVNNSKNVIYDEFVRPLERVVDFRTHISGIRPANLRKAKDFMTVQSKVAEMIKGRTLVGHALHHDLKALLLSHPKQDLRDTSVYPPFLKDGRPKALRRLAADVLGVEIQNGKHCPIQDARAALLLYQKNSKAWEKSSKEYLRRKEKLKGRRHK